jgi:hypothetical protein
MPASAVGIYGAVNGEEILHRKKTPLFGMTSCLRINLKN